MEYLESSAVAQKIKVLSLGELRRISLPPVLRSLHEDTGLRIALTSGVDGGGIRGISALLILEAIMENLREMRGLRETPKPCEYFDLIGGTSTTEIFQNY